MSLITCANNSYIYSNTLITYAILQEIEINSVINLHSTTSVSFKTVWQFSGSENMLPKSYMYTPKCLNYPPVVLGKYVIELMRTWDECKYCLEHIKKFKPVEWES